MNRFASPPERGERRVPSATAIFLPCRSASVLAEVRDITVAASTNIGRLKSTFSRRASVTVVVLHSMSTFPRRRPSRVAGVSATHSTSPRRPIGGDRGRDTFAQLHRIAGRLAVLVLNEKGTEVSE
jgi:hypothetical protein